MLKGRDVKGKGDVEGKGDGKPVVAVVRLVVVHCGAGRSSPSVGGGAVPSSVVMLRSRRVVVPCSRCRSVFVFAFHVRVAWSSRAVAVCCRRRVSLSCCCSVPRLLVACPGRVVVPRHRCAVSSLRRPRAPSLSCVSARLVGENVGWGALTMVS
jgi:hypothetical protein